MSEGFQVLLSVAAVVLLALGGGLAVYTITDTLVQNWSKIRRVFKGTHRPGG